MYRTMLKWGACALMLGAVACSWASAKEPEWDKIVIFDGFRSEGAAFGDFNKDGVVDVVSGHIWYEGPDFKKEHKFMNGEDSYHFNNYSNSFVNFVDDINGDGWDDIIICPHPGVDGFWYVNPQNKTDGFWEEKPSTIELGNESQAWEDVNGDGKNELIFNRIGQYGFCVYKADGPWDFVGVSEKNDKFQRYYHGNGAGDLNGDGRVDLLEKDGWYEAPEDPNAQWTFHPFKFAENASNILVYDFNNDGLNDVFTAYQCHLYGLVCWIQKRGADGSIDFDPVWMIPEQPGDDFFPKVSQLHSMALGDFDQDGDMDVVTGRRWMAHGENGDIGQHDPAYLLWWETVRAADGSVSFKCHVIDDNSGVGTQVMAKDVNNDNVPDILVGNKKSLVLFLSK